MAILFDGTINENVEHSARVMPAGGTTWSTITWFNPTDATWQHGAALWSKEVQVGPSRINRLQLFGATGQMKLLIFRDGTDLDYMSHTDHNFPIGDWGFIAVTFDVNRTGIVQMFHGNLAKPAIELGVFANSYQNEVNGSLGFEADNDGTFRVGEHVPGEESLEGPIAVMGVWNRVLNQAEILEQQWSPDSTRGCQLMSYYGHNMVGPGNYGVGIQPDISGHRHHGTITGSPVPTHWNPLRFSRRKRRYFVPTVAGLSIPVAMHHYTKNIGAA